MELGGREEEAGKEDGHGGRGSWGVMVVGVGGRGCN